MDETMPVAPEVAAEAAAAEPEPVEEEGAPQRVLAVVKEGDGFVLTVDGEPFDEGDTNHTILKRDSVIEIVNDAKILFGPDAVVDESAVLN